MLTRQLFSVLHSCTRLERPSQRDIVRDANLSLGTVNSALRQLREAGYVLKDNSVTEQGLAALAPYAVDNAIIMAAGLSSRFAPLSFEKPKGVLTVLGEVLVERQIRQLRQAGIERIVVVVGYMKEQFFYLEDEFGVEIVVNPDYASRNNNSTIKRVEALLGNTYICSSDDYFVENPFERYVYEPYYAAVYEEGPTEEYCLHTKGKEQRIVGVSVGGADAWTMMGHAFWNRAFSREFARVLDAVYDEPATAPLLWEDVYRQHLDELPPLYMRCYEHGLIWEFDSLDEVQAFDPDFIGNVDSQIMDNICSVLGCTRRDISGITPIKQGLTNLSFSFSTPGGTYVYRHPGNGTDAIINRASEAASQTIARELGLDNTFIYEDPETGWKISRFVPGAANLDYADWDQVAQAMRMARILHDCGRDTGYPYDMHAVTHDMIDMLSANQRTAFKDFEQLRQLVDDIHALASERGARICLCHNDFYQPNFLVTQDGIQLIDWEYSGMSDYASDLGVFICCSKDYDFEDAMRVLELYFGRAPSEDELFHCIAYVSIISFYWFVWALYKDDCGDPVGEWLYLWYRHAKRYGAKARELAGA